jgi:hypothetical protein
VTINITLSPEGVLGSDAYDDHAPGTYPLNAIEQAIDGAITDTPTPSSPDRSRVKGIVGV